MIRDRIQSLFRQNDGEGRPTPDDGQWDNVVEVSHNVSRRTARMKVLYGGKKISIDLEGIIRVSADEICVASIMSNVSAGDAVTWMKARHDEVFLAELSMQEKVLYVEARFVE